MRSEYRLKDRKSVRFCVNATTGGGTDSGHIVRSSNLDQQPIGIFYRLRWDTLLSHRTQQYFLKDSLKQPVIGSPKIRVISFQDIIDFLFRGAGGHPAISLAFALRGF
jgi:hypothetical protein